MSDVTVVIATRNRAAALRRTVGRLLELPERPQVIVVDNGSVGGPAICPPDVLVLPLGRNLGAVARNRGAAVADTPLVAFAGDDSWWAPGALDRAAGIFAEHPRLGLLAGHVLVGDDERTDPVSAFMAPATLGNADDLPGPPVLGFLACAAVVRREAFLGIGGFDPVVRSMGEEARVAYDLFTAGWGLAYRADVVAHHHPQAGADDTGKRVLAARNRVLTAWLRRPLRVAVGETTALLRAEGGDPVARRAAVQLAARLPRALANRRPAGRVLEAAIEHLEAGTTAPTSSPSAPRRSRSASR
ncbi:glycosyltransferase [Dactylosporangium fulvum]|uniref:glycosyltransferase family 2 protein n=1 Tax=Dactylosporangium fulvum TaxID=53359 RepID=UPI0031E1A137